MLDSPDDEHSTRRMTYDALGNTPQQDVGQPGSAVGTHNNAIARPFFGNAADLGRWVAPDDEGRYGDGLLGRYEAELLFSIGLDLLGMVLPPRQHCVIEFCRGDDMHQEDMGLVTCRQCECLLHSVRSIGREIGRHKEVVEHHRQTFPSGGDAMDDYGASVPRPEGRSL